MLSNSELKHHYHPAKGWMNDPNGIAFFNGYYHVFYQHAPHFENPWKEPIVWGHARTKDFLHWEELPVALHADKDYDRRGVWSGTAAVKDGILYLFYASVDGDDRQRISLARSRDGMTFEKYPGNPIIRDFPADGGKDFRDPAILCGETENYLVIASGNPEKRTGNLLLYRSRGFTDWEYAGVLYEYADCKFCECPSFVRYGDRYLLSVSVVELSGEHYFEVLYGDFDGKRFVPEIVSHFQKGPDEYAGQIFRAPDGRCILISWLTGWGYGDSEKCIGCLSLPLEITAANGLLRAYPVGEVRHLLDGNDVLTDAYLEERFVRSGEEVHIRVLKEASVPEKHDEPGK